MNKRDYFAAQAMQAIISKLPVMLDLEGDEDFNHLYFAAAKGAYNYAEAMMIVRDFEGEE
jgi:hypothetical protein